MDQFDDLFGPPNIQGPLSRKNIGFRHGRLNAIFDNAEIFMNDVHDIQKLALVFMNPFGVNVKQGIGIDFQARGLINDFLQVFLVGLFDFRKLVLKCRVIRKWLQALEGGLVRDPFAANGLVFNKSARSGLAFWSHLRCE